LEIHTIILGVADLSFRDSEQRLSQCLSKRVNDFCLSWSAALGVFLNIDEYNLQIRKAVVIGHNFFEMIRRRRHFVSSVSFKFVFYELLGTRITNEMWESSALKTGEIPLNI
jgi:hypothetical protein